MHFFFKILGLCPVTDKFLVTPLLRTLEVDTIINMVFFIHDLHYQIQELYQQQINNYRGESFVVYRDQGLSIVDFENLEKTSGGSRSMHTPQQRPIW